MQNENKNIYLWGIPFLAPILLILSSFLMSYWGWGLMDDLSILNTGSGIKERFVLYHSGLVDWGVFRPTYVFYTSIFYTLFENSPKLFYIFRLLLIVFTLGVWGKVLQGITNRKSSFLILPAVTLSFHYFYDAFYYLSSQELLGLLPLGLALLLTVDQLKEKKALSWFTFIPMMILLIISFCAKEPFVSTGIALGLTLIIISISKWNQEGSKKLLIQGIIVCVITVIFAFLLFMGIKSDYTSSYGISDLSKLFSNLKVWVKKDFLNHLPWVLASIAAINISKKHGRIEKSSLFNFGIILGVLLYSGYVLILLPWNPVSYYATPLGVFFAFIVTIIISHCWSGLSKTWSVMFILFSLSLNLVVCQYALARESSYQRDVGSLLSWIKPVVENHDIEGQPIMYTNAMEAGAALPLLIKKNWNKDVKSFHHLLDLNGVLETDKDQYYIYSPRFQFVDLKILEDNLKFDSENWKVYQLP